MTSARSRWGPRWTWVALVLGVVASTGVEAAAQQPTAESQIRETVERYVVGWREGDLERLANAFSAETGVVLWRSGDPGEEMLAGMTFADILARGSRPNPDYGTEWDIVELDIVDDQLAVARVDIARRDARYTDVLVLYRLAEGWRIVTKTFVVR